MRERRLEEKPACSVKSSPFPEEIKCPDCGTEAELWSDEFESVCRQCGTMIHKYNT